MAGGVPAHQELAGFRPADSRGLSPYGFWERRHRLALDKRFRTWRPFGMMRG
jgi:hypothetical protein